MPAYTFRNVQQMVGKDTYQTINNSYPWLGKEERTFTSVPFFPSYIKHVAYLT